MVEFQRCPGGSTSAIHTLFRITKWVPASLVAQWLRIRLPMQGTWVQALVREDPTCRGATKPVRHSYWACALEPMSHNYWAHAPPSLKPLCSRARAPQQEKPPEWEARALQMKTQHSQNNKLIKINKFKKQTNKKNTVSSWRANAWNLLAREPSKESRDKRDRLSLYLYSLHIHSFRQTLKDCPANNFHIFFSHFPFSLFFLWNDFSFPLLSAKIVPPL